MRARITNGIVTAEEIKVEGTAVRIALGGRAVIPERNLDLKGTAMLAQPEKGKESFELPFVVLGRFDDPAILPDPQALIRRSGAAAPLLNAVRDRRARDAARSAAEQIGEQPVGTDQTPPPQPQQ